MSRTPQEIFAHHAEALMAGDIDGIVADYNDDAVFITPAGALHGKHGVRQGFTALHSMNRTSPSNTCVKTSHFAFGRSVSSAVAAATTALDGIDTFVFDGDGIRVQTVRYT